MRKQRGFIDPITIGFIIVLGIAVAGAAHAQEGSPVEEPSDDMDQLYALVQANAEAIQSMQTSLMGALSVMAAEAPTTQPVPIPPEEPVLGLTAPRRVVLPQEGRYAKPLYLEEAPEQLPVTTRVFNTPPGFTMQLIEQAPQYVVTEYQQPDVWKAIPDPVAIQPIVEVGEGNVSSIAIIVDEPIQ